MTTHRPSGMSDRERELWRTCVAQVLSEREQRREEAARRERARNAALIARARAILREARHVPPAPVDRGALGGAIAHGLAWLAANVEAGVHVSVDYIARRHFEAALLAFEIAAPGRADIGWWHALDAHSMSLDDPDGLCSCGQTDGGFLTLDELHRRAREKYESVSRAGGGRWDGVR